MTEPDDLDTVHRALLLERYGHRHPEYHAENSTAGALRPVTAGPVGPAPPRRGRRDVPDPRDALDVHAADEFVVAAGIADGPMPPLAEPLTLDPSGRALLPHAQGGGGVMWGPVVDLLEVVPPPDQDPPCACYRRHWTDGSWRMDLDPYCLTHGVTTAGPCPMYGCLRYLSHLGAHGPVVTV